MKKINSILLFFILFSGMFMVTGCAPVWIMNQPEPQETQEIPVYRPVDWDHILLTDRVKEKVSLKDKIVFVAEIGTSNLQQYAIFWSDSEGKNLKKLYDVQDGSSAHLKPLGNGEKLLATRALSSNGFFIFIDAQNGAILKEITEVGHFSFSPDEKKIVFEKREGKWESGFDLCVLDMGDDTLPKSINKIIHFSPNIERRRDAVEKLGQTIVRGNVVTEPSAAIQWNKDKIIFMTDQYFWQGAWGPYSIFRTYSVNLDGTNLQKIEERTEKY